MNLVQKSKRFLYFYILIAFIFLSSCGSIKPYPVCYYDCTKPKVESREEITIRLADFLRLESKKVSVHPNNRWILAKTNFLQHRRLIKIWPRMACIGNVTAGTEVTTNAKCVNYILEFMSKKQYLEFDIDYDDSAHSDEAPGSPHIICCCELD